MNTAQNASEEAVNHRMLVPVKGSDISSRGQCLPSS